MGASVQLNLPPMPLNGIERPVSTTLNPVEHVVAALARAGISQKAAALDMGIDQGQLSRQLRGTEHLSVQRLAALPVTFWRELTLLLASALGLSINGPDAERQALADVVESMSRYLRVVGR